MEDLVHKFYIFSAREAFQETDKEVLVLQARTLCNESCAQWIQLFELLIKKNAEKTGVINEALLLPIFQYVWSHIKTFRWDYFERLMENKYDNLVRVLFAMTFWLPPKDKFFNCDDMQYLYEQDADRICARLYEENYPDLAFRYFTFMKAMKAYKGHYKHLFYVAEKIDIYCSGMEIIMPYIARKHLESCADVSESSLEKIEKNGFESVVKRIRDYQANQMHGCKSVKRKKI